MRDDEDGLFEAYRLPDEAWHPAAVAARVLQMPEHAHLVDGDATIDWLMRVEPKRRGGRDVLGTACMPKVSGELSEMFDWLLMRLLGRMPDFLIVLDLQWWLDADARLREILVFHELAHCVQKDDAYGAPRFDRDGLPVWGLKGHDVEEFTSVVARYGQWNADIRAFVEAANVHA